MSSGGARLSAYGRLSWLLLVLAAAPPGGSVDSHPFYFLADCTSGKVTALAADDPRVTGGGEVSSQMVGLNLDVGGAPLALTATVISSFPGTPGRRLGEPTPADPQVRERFAQVAERYAGV